MKTLKYLATPPGFTRFHRIVSASFLALLLGAVAVYISTTDGLTAGDVAFKLSFVIIMWAMARFVLMSPGQQRTTASSSSR